MSLRTRVDRREFLRSSMLFGGVAPLCCTTPAAPPGSVRFEGSTLVLDLGQIPDLSEVGSACAVVDAGRKVNIIVARAGARRYVALERSCTHGGAQCTYVHSRRRLRCTSLNHAEYELDGTLLHGRTHGNLRAYPVRLDGARLRIALESPWQGRRGASGAEALLHESGNTVNRVLPESPA